MAGVEELFRGHAEDGGEAAQLLAGAVILGEKEDEDVAGGDQHRRDVGDVDGVALGEAEVGDIVLAVEEVLLDVKGEDIRADTTRGLYLTAETADELMTALRTVAAPAPPMLRLEALAGVDGAVVDDPALRWTVVALDSEDTVLDGAAVARPELDLDAGRYFARAELGNRSGSVQFDYSGDVDALHQLVLAVAAELDAFDAAEAGRVIEVRWTGPNAPGDYIALAEPGAQPASFITYARTDAGSPAALTLPETPGVYELRYVDGAGGRVLTSAGILVTAAAATLDAAPAIGAGAEIRVTWTGPGNRRDFISIATPGQEDGKYIGYTYPDRGSPLNVKAPEAPGSYELRYVTAQDRKVLARLPITVN